jgi:hypothetical protein
MGPFGAELALLLHGPRTPAVVDQIERTADDVLLPLTGWTLRSALATPQTLHGIALEGEGLAFAAAKESDADGFLVLRCVNLVDEPRAGRWTLGAPIREAHRARLDETPVERLVPAGNTVEFVAGPRDVATILVR